MFTYLQTSTNNLLSETTSNSNNFLYFRFKKIIQKLCQVKAEISILKRETNIIYWKLDEAQSNFKNFQMLNPSSFDGNYSELDAEITKEATDKELKKLYSKMVKNYHPDNNRFTTIKDFHKITQLFQERDIESLYYQEYCFDNANFLKSSDSLTKLYSIIETELNIAQLQKDKLSNNYKELKDSTEYAFLKLQHTTQAQAA